MQSQAPYRFITNKDVQEASDDSPFYFVTQANPVFSSEEMKALREMADKDAEPASVYVDNVKNGKAEIESDIAHEARRSHAVWLHQEQHKWIYDRIWNMALAVNKIYKIDIDSFELAQIAYYDEKEQGHFDWHSDNGPTSMRRKLSISIPLNDPTEYEGGDILFNAGGQILAPPQTQGKLIIFPSWVVHKVTPVTKGRRYSMVIWIHGPRWR